jgi:hypothetical protein
MAVGIGDGLFTNASLSWRCLVTRPLGRNFFRSGVSIERGLKHYAWHLYGHRNFLDTFPRKSIATSNIITNPPSYNDDNKLNFHLPVI